MAEQPDSSQSLVRTVFLSSSIHCPTCTYFIEDLLFRLRPQIRTVEASIINHSVTVSHEPGLDLQVIVTALIEAGYGVDGVITDSNTTPDKPKSYTSPNLTSDGSWFIRAAHSLVDRTCGDNINEKTEKQIHVEHCKQCQEQLTEPATPEENQITPSTTERRNQFVVIDPSASLKLYQALLTIGGMSCSSCVGTITSALEENAWVKTASVSLLTRTATVQFYQGHKAEELVSIIEDHGYDATIEQVDEITESESPTRVQTDLWKANFSISGMTCSSCVGAITRALQDLPWMKSIDVNLLSNSATAVFENKRHLDEIIEKVGDIGYNAQLNDLVDMNKAQTKQTRRTVMIRIHGMYCEHCPSRVIEAIKSLGERVVLEEAPALTSPIATISYVPQAPGLTIRSILAVIKETENMFEVTIYHPPTVEERSAQMHARMRRHLFYRIILSLAAAIPSLVIGIIYMNLVSKSDPSAQFLMQAWKGVTRAEWSLLVTATPVYFFAADVFHRRTIKELYALWRPGSKVPLLRRFYRFGSMDMLVSLATSIAYFGSIVEIIIATQLPPDNHMEGLTHLDSVVFLTLFLLVGRMIEAYSKAKTGEAVTKLGSLRPKEALLITAADGGNTRIQNTDIDQIDVGDTVRIVHGGSPPWDGTLIEGETEFMESSLTGESRPIKKRLGDDLYSGTINQGAAVTMRITGAPGDSLLDQIIKVVREGQIRRAPIERVADAITGYFVPVVTLIAVVTWLTWLGLGLSGRLPDDYLNVSVGGWPFWSLQFAIAVFVIACPCGIGLAAPTALFVGGGLAAAHGILVKGGGEAFQEASHLDIIAFDKTGTLTEGGEPKLTDHRFVLDKDGPLSEHVIISCLRELESNSSHPIAKAVVAFCKSREAATVTTTKSIKIGEVPGKGMKGSFKLSSPSSSSPDPIEIIAGNEGLMTDHGVIFPDDCKAQLNSWKEQAKSVVLAAARSGANSPWVPAAILATSDPVRAEAGPVIAALRRQGIDVWMISGDNALTAAAVGTAVGIPADRIIAGVLPEQKAEKVAYLQKSQVKETTTKFPFSILRSSRHTITRRAIVAMVGDGVNDSPALVAADVGVAIGSGSDVAVSAAEFVLVGSANLAALITLTSLSRAVFRRVKLNFAWALVYNLVALPIAAGVLYPIRSGSGSYTRLDPAWAALAMALSSISVIGSSLLLRTRLPLVGYRHKAPTDLN